MRINTRNTAKKSSVHHKARVDASIKKNNSKRISSSTKEIFLKIVTHVQLCDRKGNGLTTNTGISHHFVPLQMGADGDLMVSLNDINRISNNMIASRQIMELYRDTMESTQSQSKIAPFPIETTPPQSPPSLPTPPSLGLSDYGIENPDGSIPSSPEPEYDDGSNVSKTKSLTVEEMERILQDELSEISSDDESSPKKSMYKEGETLTGSSASRKAAEFLSN